ncbi:uncharacterized protein LTR77_007287 [Saxophila tyrrhenica]|uniref:DUF427 domain-containing protein n=1 Tax=Saxophila tyrrhenica TaxID=1690608 RepID=A0AAV9P492_9PEZI|nr:hypothetical protein LTR77_007287 [Saxophila tyrrhenica]
MHARATISGTTIADTDSFEFVEGNVYFPVSSVVDREKTLTPGSRTSHCPWKGDGKYYDLHVNGQTIANAAWYYPAPYEKAKMIKDCVAFDKSKVTVGKD